MKQSPLDFLFSKLYKKWLWNSHSKDYDKVIEVSNWRCALIESTSGNRKRICPCFKLFGIKFN